VQTFCLSYFRLFFPLLSIILKMKFSRNGAITYSFLHMAINLIPINKSQRNLALGILRTVDPISFWFQYICHSGVTFHAKRPRSSLKFAFFSSVYTKTSHGMFTGKCQAVSNPHRIYLQNIHGHAGLLIMFLHLNTSKY
jgi:hypothetical protein